MSLLNEIREDMRLARLNNPGYGFLFRALDVAEGLFKLFLLAAFGLGIWHIVYDLGAPESASKANQYAEASENPGAVATAGADTAEPEVGALTPERIDMLRQFASENRHTIAAKTPGDEAGTVDLLPVESTGPTIAKVQMPEAIVDQSVTVEPAEPLSEIIVGGDIVPLPVEQPLSVLTAPLELESKGVFDELEKKLQKPFGSKAADWALEPVDPALGNDVPQQVLAESEVIESPVNESTTTPLVVEDNGGINPEAWLLAQDANLYTIQIGSTSNRPFLVRFADLLPEGEPVSIFYYVYRNRPEYGLGYGLFESKEEANAALDGLSQKVRRYGAFARELSVIQKQIKQLSDQVAVARK